MRLLLLLAAVLLAAVPIQAQDAASVNWSLTEADGLAVTSQEGGAVGSAVTSMTLVVRDYTGTLSGDANGPLGPYQRWWLDGAEWPVESAPDSDRYVEFAVTAADGSTFDVTTVDLVMNAAGTGELDASLFYDTDPSFSAPTALETEIDVSRDEVGRFTYEIEESLAAGQSLYVRVYPWLGGGNASATRYLLLQDVTVSGTGTPNGGGDDVEGVFWALTAADTTSVTSASEGLGGAMVRSMDVEVRDYTGDLRDANDAVGPLGPFQRWWRGEGVEWPDEDAPDPDRYVEFAAGADDGFSFRVDSLSVYVHGDGTSAMRARVAYSTDADFSDPVILEEEMMADDGDTAGRPILRSYEIGETASDSIYVRIYPWVRSSSTSDGRYLLLQAMAIYGEAENGTPTTTGPESARFTLHPSAPNPVATSTTLRYELAEASDVEVVLVNVLGQRITTLASGPMTSGAHALTVDVTGLAAGTYFVHMVAGGQAQTRPFVVVR